MSISLQTLSHSVFLTELLVPDTHTFTVQGVDLVAQSCTAVCKVRQTLASASAIITLSSPTDIVITSDTSNASNPVSTVAVTFTSAHFTSLLAGLTGTGVIDCIVSPSSGAPQMLFKGDCGVERVVSR